MLHRKKEGLTAVVSPYCFYVCGEERSRVIRSQTVTSRSSVASETRSGTAALISSQIDESR